MILFLAKHKYWAYVIIEKKKLVVAISSQLLFSPFHVQRSVLPLPPIRKYLN